MERAESTRLVRALLLSFIVHLLCFGIYLGGKKADLWKHFAGLQWSPMPKLLVDTRQLSRPKSAELQAKDLPLVFVQVSPAQATIETPKDAQYYSDRNSRAANKQPDKESTVPKIAGDQNRMVKTEDVQKEEFVPLRPNRPSEEVAQKEQEEEKAAPAVQPGDLQVGKPDPVEKPDEGVAKKSRPRTIVAALAKKGATQLPGRKMHQEGGVKRRLQLDSLDAKATPFGAYDNALVEAISARWHSLLYDRDYATYTSGRVVLRFRLHHDGRISELTVAENTVGEVLGLICEKAVRDPAPYPAWPSDLRRMAGETRSIQFTFYYN